MEQKNKAPTPSVKSFKDMFDFIAAGFAKVDHNFQTVKQQVDILILKFDGLESKVDGLETRIDALEKSTTEGFKDVRLKLENLTKEIAKIKEVTRYDEQHKNLKSLG